MLTDGRSDTLMHRAKRCAREIALAVVLTVAALAGVVAAFHAARPETASVSPAATNTSTAQPN